MNNLEPMLHAHPQPAADLATLAATLTALARCELTCLSCADACLGEDTPAKLRGCIRHDLDCAAVCRATAEVLLRHTSGPGSVLHAQLHACIVACQECGDVCEAHAHHHRHCAICAQVCRECQALCNEALAAFAPSAAAATA